MTQSQMSARVGLFFLLGAALIWVTYEALSGNELKPKNAYELTARFSSLKELKTGDEVRMAGVAVGVVKQARLVDRTAEIVLQIRDTIEVASDSTATIAMSGLLGSNYVSLTLGSPSAPPLAPGSQLRSEDTPDLNTVVSQFGDIGRKVEEALSQFSGALGTDGEDGIMGRINALVDENSTRIAAITTNLETITNKINTGEGTLGKLVNDPQAYDELVSTLTEIRAAADEAKTFVADARGIVDQVKSGEGTLGALLYDGDTGDNLKIVAANLRELSEKLNNGNGTLGRLINDDSLFIEAQNAVQKVNRAVDGMADQGPITAVGVAANTLF